MQASVFAPNRTQRDGSGASLLSPTGWLKVRPPACQPTAPATVLDAAQSTDYQQLFDKLVQTVQDHAWPAQEPYFERLDIRVDLPAIDVPLSVDHECISSLEALHEDIYFSLLELFQRQSGRLPGDRRLQPGQIVPDVRACDGPPRLHIGLSRFSVEAQDRLGAAQGETTVALARLTHAAHPDRVACEMARLDGHRFWAPTRQGRKVAGLYQAGPGPAVLISGGQHANETSGVVGALRAAQALQAAGQAHFALIALENPDGYALHRELCRQHPSHLHHAARYSALGDDIEYREQPPLYERAARDQALALSGAQLHINLHGYPAHEWTRPMSGYLPRGFELWTIPKGFFLILRHQPGWQKEGRALLEQVSAALAEVAGLPAYNARQFALYQAHAGELPFELLPRPAEPAVPRGDLSKVAKQHLLKRLAPLVTAADRQTAVARNFCARRQRGGHGQGCRRPHASVTNRRAHDGWLSGGHPTRELMPAQGLFLRCSPLVLSLIND